MTLQNTMTSAVDPDAKSLYRVGGVSAFVLVVVYFLTFPLYAWVGDPPPGGVEAQLSYFAEHATVWWVITGLMVFTDLLYIPIFSSLYQALKGISRSAMLLATGFIALFVALDLAVTWTAYSTLITSGGNYAAATTNAQRAVFVAAAAYPSAILDSPLSDTYSILFPALGVFLIGLVMLKGIFNKATAYLAVAMGITGIIFMGSYVVGALSVFRIINALLATVFYLFAGYRLYRLGRH